MRNVFMAAAVAVALSGCATIFNGQTQSVTIKSEPEGASLAITNVAGEKVHTGTTPATVTLKRGAPAISSPRPTRCCCPSPALPTSSSPSPAR